MSSNDTARRISVVIQENEQQILEAWIGHLNSLTFRKDAAAADQLRRHCTQLLALLPEATLAGGTDNIEGRAWDEVRNLLAEISGQRAKQGSTPSETATFVFSLKQSLFVTLRTALTAEPAVLADALWGARPPCPSALPCRWRRGPRSMWRKARPRH